MPHADVAMKSSNLIRDATLKICPGASHGLTGAHEQEFNAGLLAFLAF